jgi:transposase InsO family protein
MGIRDQPTSPRSPWQNGYVERLIGSMRRECLDHVVALGERHLRHVLLSYMKYYNEMRTHSSLEKDAPFSRAIEPPGRFFAAQFSAGCTTNMSGFYFRQTQRPIVINCCN